MKRTVQVFLVLLAVSLLSPLPLSAVGPRGCYIDTDYGFSIYVPPDWRRQDFDQGDARVYQFNSPAPNTFIQLRIFPAGPGETPASVADTFESNTFPSARRATETGFTLNGQPGLMATYRMPQAGSPVDARAFYTVHDGRAYALWSAVSGNASPSVRDEVYGAFKTFSLAEAPLSTGKRVPPPLPEGTWSSGEVAVVELMVGTRMADAFQVIPQDRIPDAAREITAVFQWQGRPGEAPFTMRWVQISKGRVFREFPVKAAAGTRGWGKGSIVRGDLRWSLGEWAVEIHHGGTLLKRKSFTIVPK